MTTCEICGKTVTKRALGRHMKVIHLQTEFIYQCELCGKNFGYKSIIRNHMLTHVSKEFRYIQPYKIFHCDFPGCGKEFFKKRILSDHKRYCHIKQATYHCSQIDCDRTFKTPQKLRRHVMITHQKMRRNCPIEGCYFMVGRVDYMRNHVKKHFELDPQEIQNYLEVVKKMKLLS